MKRMIFVAALAAFGTLFSCSKDSGVTTGYEYYYNLEKVVWYVDAEKKAIESELNAALGNPSNTAYVAHYSNDDQKIISACNAIKAKYSDLQTVYFKYVIYRKTVYGGSGESVLATYEFGDALKHKWTFYNYKSNYQEVMNAFTAIMRDPTQVAEEDAPLYHHGMYAIEKEFNSLWSYDKTQPEKYYFTRPWLDTENDDNYIKGAADDLYTNYYANPTYQTYYIWDDITYHITKTDVIDDTQVTEIWSKTWKKKRAEH